MIESQILQSTIVEILNSLTPSDAVPMQKNLSTIVEILNSLTPYSGKSRDYY